MEDTFSADSGETHSPSTEDKEPLAMHTAEDKMFRGCDPEGVHGTRLALSRLGWSLQQDAWPLVSSSCRADPCGKVFIPQAIDGSARCRLWEDETAAGHSLSQGQAPRMALSIPAVELPMPLSSVQKGLPPSCRAPLAPP